MKHIRTAACLILCAALVALGVHTANAKKKTYNIVVPVIEGFSMGSASALMKDAATTLSKKTGYNFKIQELKYKRGESPFNDVLEMFKKKKADFTYVQALEYVEYLETGDKTVKPLFTMAVDGKPYNKVCGFVRKEDKITSAKKLKGKTMGGTGLVTANWWLYRNKIDKDAFDFFGKVKFVSDNPPANLLDALIEEKIDVFVLQDFMVDMVLNGQPKYSKKVEKIKCKQFDHNFIFVYRKGVSKKVLKKVQSNFLNAHKDKDYRQFHFLFKAINGKFVKFKSKNLKTTKAILKKANKEGWFEQEKEFQKKYQ